MLLIDKYRLKNIDETFFNKKIFEMIKIMCKDESIPHLCFYGADGAGKKTIVRILLENIFNDDVNKLTDTLYKITGSSNKEVDICVKQSNYHVIIKPNNNNFDRYLIQDVVKKYAQLVPLNFFKIRRQFKVILIKNIDNLSYYAQTSLRRTMEKYSSTCRFIMLCNSLNKIIDPIQSRCLCIRVNSPTNQELLNYLLHVSFNEKLDISINNYANILNLSNGNIKLALLYLEQLKQIGHIELSSYHLKIIELVDIILNKNIDDLQNIRKIIYSFLLTNIEGSVIMKDILYELINRDIINKNKICDHCSKYELNLIKGRRCIIHIESFILSVMCELS